MSSAALTSYICKFCGRSFDEGRKLGGHIRQSHRQKNRDFIPADIPFIAEGEMAARILEMWKQGEDPYKIIVTLRVHPRFVKIVLSEYDGLLDEWKKFSEASVRTQDGSSQEMA